MGIKLANNAFGTLAAGIASGDTSITLTTGHGARFPSLGAGDYFYATLIDTSNNLEIVKCTARSTDVLTVVRAQEGTSARAYSTGDRIEIRLTAQTFVDATNAVNSEYDNTTSGLAATNVQDAIDTIGKPATQTEAETGTNNTNFITPLRLREGLRASGAAPVYACRAWVSFNGTGTVAIRASGNVSSITDNGTGDYTVNFTTALTDTDYVVTGTCFSTSSGAARGFISSSSSADYSPATGSFRFCSIAAGVGNTDYQYEYIAVFR